MCPPLLTDLIRESVELLAAGSVPLSLSSVVTSLLRKQTVVYLIFWLENV